MKAGRPHTHRYRLLTAPVTDGGIKESQRRAVWDVLRKAFRDDPPDGLQEALEQAYFAYRADAAALDKSVGAAVEVADMRAIAKDCRQLANAIPAAVERLLSVPLEQLDAKLYPQELCLRLRQRLKHFPLTADAQLFVTGVDIWPLVERLREKAYRPAVWCTDPTIPVDLIRLADACDSCPAPPLHTSPRLLARDRLDGAIRAALEPFPFKVDNKTERSAFVRSVMRALGIKAPKKL